MALGAFVPGATRAQDNAAQAGEIGIAVDTAEVRETIELASFPDPFVPANGEYLIVWLTVANTGTAVAEYDYCPPEIACVIPVWFEVVDESGTAYAVDELIRAVFEQSEEQILGRFQHCIATTAPGTDAIFGTTSSASKV